MRTRRKWPSRRASQPEICVRGRIPHTRPRARVLSCEIGGWRKGHSSKPHALFNAATVRSRPAAELGFGEAALSRGQGRGLVVAARVERLHVRLGVAPRLAPLLRHRRTCRNKSKARMREDDNEEKKNKNKNKNKKRNKNNIKKKKNNKNKKKEKRKEEYEQEEQDQEQEQDDDEQEQEEQEDEGREHENDAFIGEGAARLSL